MTLTFRPITPDDMDFLAAVYASSREEEMALVLWSEAEKAAFLRQQFEAQHHYYSTHYIGAHFELIVQDGQPIGRRYLYWMDDEIRLMEITLLTAYRGQGLGERLIREVMAMAEAEGRAVRLHVEQFNRALRLYERLGYAVIDTFGVYYKMEWKPQNYAFGEKS